MTVKQYIETQSDKEQLNIYVNNQPLSLNELDQMIEKFYTDVYFTRVDQLLYPDKVANLHFTV